MTEKTERQIKDRSKVIIAAACFLIDTVRVVERAEGDRSMHGEMEFTVKLPGGGVETWVIRIERTASSH
jgi:hypothetical protein